MDIRGVDLKAERVRLGLTQAELGTRLGVSGRRIANVEKEYRPAATMVHRITSALREEASRQADSDATEWHITP
jgi:transcriptional regulator with XRE-family HTH domain